MYNGAKVTLCKNWYFVGFGAPTVSQTTEANGDHDSNMNKINIKNYKMP